MNPYAHTHTVTAGNSTSTTHVFAVPSREALDASLEKLRTAFADLAITYTVLLGGFSIAYPVGVTWHAGDVSAQSPEDLFSLLRGKAAR